MAQAIEERAQQLVQRTRTELMNEATKMRAQFEDERARHQVEMERLGKQRVQMLMQLEATARVCSIMRRSSRVGKRRRDLPLRSTSL